MKNERAFQKALAFFPPAERMLLSRCAGSVDGAVCEIRLYAEKAAMLQTDAGMYFCLNDGGLSASPGPDRWIPSSQRLSDVLNRAASFSLYLHENTLRDAFLTAGGCRIGVCGWREDGRLGGCGVTSLNIRIPFTADFAPDPMLLAALRAGGGLLIAGPPGSGKTTLLKQCVRLLASGALGRYVRTAVVDTRGEFSAQVLEDPSVLSADLLTAAEKGSGIETAVRLFSPEYVVCDEIGGDAEIPAVLGALNTGVSFLASAHAADLQSLLRRRQIVRLIAARVFDRILFLSGDARGRPVFVCSGEEAEHAIRRRAAAGASAFGAGHFAGGAAEKP